MSTRTTSTDTGSLDRIEQRIDIDASAQAVYDLVSQPGWWINEGGIVDHDIDRDGDRAVVHDPTYGDFTMVVDALEPPRYAAFRWLVESEGQEESATRVEFFVEDRDEGGVVLRVVESGFESLSLSAGERRERYDGNVEGWTKELAAARDHLEGAGSR